MSLSHAILGWLSREPLTGYDLKKRFADSEILYWSGNSNQIYSALLELHRAGLVAQQVEQPASGPARKVYTLSEQGAAELRAWLLSTPEPPQVRHPFLVRLIWADQLSDNERADLLARYEDELRAKLLVLREQASRQQGYPGGSAGAVQSWAVDMQRWLAIYEEELAWLGTLHTLLADEQEG